MSVRSFSEYERGFIEGFLDADGCITLHKGKIASQVVISFSNNSKEILEKIASIIGKRGTQIKKIDKRGFQSWELRYYTRDSYEILRQIKLVVKEKRRLLALEIEESKIHIGGRTPLLLKKAYREYMSDLYGLFRLS